MCGICENILDKDKRGIIMVTIFFLHKEVIDVFHEKNYTTTIEKLSFHMAHVRIIGPVECGKTRNIFPMIMH